MRSPSCLTDTPQRAFAALTAWAESDPRALALAVTGSRATGLHHDDRSDHDCALFVLDGAEASSRADLTPHAAALDLRVFTPTTFAAHAAWGGPDAWDRYTWAIARFVVERDGGVTRAAARAKGRVPPAAAEATILAALDAHLNAIARAARCIERGDRIAARLEAAQGVQPFWRAAFALHDRRLVPYAKFLAWELRRQPLTRFGLAPDALLTRTAALITQGDLPALADSLARVQKTFTDEAHLRLFRAWDVDAWWPRYFHAHINAG